MYVKTDKKKLGEKNCWTPLSEKTGARNEKQKTLKIAILGLKRAKYDRKK